MFRKQRKGWSAATADTSPNAIRLLYARSGPEEPEPLIAVVSTEEEARAIEEEISNGKPEIRVMWETHRVVGQFGETVHIVILVAGAETYQEAADPIGMSVHANRSGAEREIAMFRKNGDDAYYIVRSLPLGWRRAGWPFMDNQSLDLV